LSDFFWRDDCFFWLLSCECFYERARELKEKLLPDFRRWRGHAYMRGRGRASGAYCGREPSARVGVVGVP